MTKNRTTTNCRFEAKNNHRSGVALMLALVVLVILSGVVYKLVSNLRSLEHRQQYLIDYQKARYACDSGMRYALSRMPGLTVGLPNRKDYPELLDFSDEFWMDEQHYDEVARQWAQGGQTDGLDENYDQQSEPEDPNKAKLMNLLAEMFPGEDFSEEKSGEPEKLTIPGPYNVEWPNVIEPIEYEIDGVKVTIAIEDENAKYPLIWFTQTGNIETQKAAAESLKTVVGTWMGQTKDQMDALFEQLDKVAEYKQFRFSYPAVTITETVKSSTSGRNARARTRTPAKRTVKKPRPDEEHARDFAKLMFSSIVDIESLSEPMEFTGKRQETPIKYLGVWGSDKVNINTAPRHVLEGAFTFGGEPVEIASEIIRLRREKQFANISDLKERMYGYNDSIQRAAPYITFRSEYFSIKVTAQSGKARSVMTAAVFKKNKDVKKVAAFSY